MADDENNQVTVSSSLTAASKSKNDHKNKKITPKVLVLDKW